MGVHGLWRLLDTFGEVTQPEEWCGRRVAIDASIWMAQFRARSRPGEDLSFSVLEGFFVRILKLLFYGIEPVFVFDGPASSTKTAEHHRRQLRREALAHALVKRRAKQLLSAQIAAGTLDVSLLPTVKLPEASKGDEEEVKTTMGIVADEGGVLPPVPSLRTTVKRKRRTPLAPEAMSEAVTLAFLEEIGGIIEARKMGEKCVLANTLKNAGSSLYLGPRQVVEGRPVGQPPTVKPRPEGVCILEEDEVSSTADDLVYVLGSSSSEYPSSSLSDTDSVHVKEGQRVHPVRTNAPPEVHRIDAIELFNQRQTETSRLSPSVLSVQTLTSVSSMDDADDSEATSGHLDYSHESSGDSIALDGRNAFLWSPHSSFHPLPATQSQAILPPHPVTPPLCSSCKDDDFTPVKLRDGHFPLAPSSTDSTFNVENNSNHAINEAPLSYPMDAGGTGKINSLPSAAAASTTCAVRFPLPGGAPHCGRATSRVIPFELVEIIQLLEYCGIAYVLSPSEADAQCAFLAREGLVDAVFTEDSDVFVHGSPVVLRGFFAKGKHVVAYRARDLEVCGVNKCVFVALAQLLGCDYTEGAAGIGLVGALDAIVAAWLPNPESSEKVSCGAAPSRMEDSSTDGVDIVQRLLLRWRNLVELGATSWPIPEDEYVTILQFFLLKNNQKKWRELRLPERFPDAAVSEAFYHPVVDTDSTPFPPTSPDWQGLHRFAAGHGLFSSSWIAQRFELARNTWVERTAAKEQTASLRRLEDFGMGTKVRERWIYKKQPPQQTIVLSFLRAVQQQV